MLWCASMVNASKIKRSLVSLDESQDLLVEVESGVPDQGPIPEDPQHHPAAAFPPGRRRDAGENAAGGVGGAGGGSKMGI